MWHTYQTSIIIAFSIAFMLSTFWLFPNFAFIIFISLLLDMLLTVPNEKLRKKTHVSHGISAAITMTVFLIFLFVLIFMLSRTLLPSLQHFVLDLPLILERIHDLLLSSIPSDAIQDFNSLWESFANFGVEALKSSINILLTIFSKFINIVIIVFVTFYLLRDGENIKHWIAGLFPHHDYIRMLLLFNSILKSLRAYVISQLTVCFLTALVVFLYFLLRDLPYAVVFAVLSGISEFIPVLGPTVASIFAIVFTITLSPLIAIQTTFFFLILTQTNHNFIYPSIIGKRLNLHPLSIILGIILGGELLGAPGMFLSVPCMVIIRYVIIDIFNDIKKKKQ